MAKRAPLIITLFACLSTQAMGVPIEVLQPNETAYSIAELATLLPALEQLDEVLNDTSLGSQHSFRPNDWNSLDFSAYTSGTLEQLGYTTQLVTAEDWSDGEHAWVLVEIVLSERTAWIPMEPSPDPGETQLALGHIPSVIDTAGWLWFETPFLGFSNEVHLPPNSHPVAIIRSDMTRASVGQAVMFMALASYDPDGEIVRYYWDLGDGTSAQAKTVLHPFKEAGDYTISLTVTDSRGASDTTTTTLLVVEPKATSSGCGCGE